jgi:hypothetical protein
MIFVLISARANDLQRLSDHARDTVARQQFEQLEEDGPILH